MSRTNKDVPFWVKANRMGVIEHNHERVGQPRYKRQIKRDDEGNPVMQTVERYRRLHFRVHTENPAIVVDSYLDALGHARGHYELIEVVREKYEVEEPVSEDVIVGYYEHCENHVEPYESGKLYYQRWGNDVQCTLEIPWTGVYRYRSNRPQAEEKRAYQQQARRKESNNLKKYADSYNSGWDLEEYEDFVDVETRSQFHVGCWN